VKSKKTLCGLRKSIISAGIGILAAASAASMVPVSAYAASVAETREEVPGVSGSHNVDNSVDRPGPDSVFEVMEVDRLWYRVTITVIDAASKKPISDAYVVLEDTKTNVVAGLKDGSSNYFTDGNGQITFLLEIDHEYRMTIKKSGYKASEWNGKSLTYENGNQNQTIEIELEKDSEKPTEPVNPTEPTTPSKGDGGGKDHGDKDKDRVNPTKPTETRPAETQPTPAPTPEETRPEGTRPQETRPRTEETTAPEETKPGETKPDKEEDKEYILPGKDNKTGTEDDIIVRPDKDKDGKDNSSQDKDGKVTLPDGGHVIYPSFPDQGKIEAIVPPGTVVLPDGTIRLPDGTRKEYQLPGKDASLRTGDDVYVIPAFGDDGNDHSYVDDEGRVVLVDGGTVNYPDGSKTEAPAGSMVLPDGTIIYPASAKADWTCYFHWIELVFLLLILLLASKRLMEIHLANKELDEMEEEAEKLE